MSSKFIRFSLLTVVFLQIGCGLKTGETPKNQKVAELSSASCIKNSLDNLKKYPNGEATDDEVGAALECLQTAVTAFKDNVRGADHDKYTLNEVFDFIFKKFLKSDTELSPEFIAEISKFKALLIGGEPGLITRPELDAVNNVIARLKPEAVRLNPHIKVLLSKWEPSIGDRASEIAKLEAAQAALRTSLARIGRMFEATGRSYENTDLIQLALEAAKLFKADSKTIDTISKAEDLVLKLKTNLIGGNSLIQGNEWPALFSLAAEAYSQYLRIHYFLEPLKDEQTDEKIEVYKAVASDILEVLPSLLETHQAKDLKNTQILEILAAAKPLFPAFEKVQPEFINQIGKIKLIVVGKINNSFEAWTINDITTLKSKLPEYVGIAKVAVKSLKQYEIDDKAFRSGKITKEAFLEAEKALNLAIENLSTKILYSYDLEDVKKLVISLKPLLEDTLKLPENLDAWFKVIYTAKVALTGEPGSHLSVRNIQQLFKIGIRFYGNVVEVSNFVVPFSLEEAEATLNIEPWVIKVKDTIALVLSLKASHEVTTAELTELVMAAQEAQILTTKIQKSSVVTFLDAVWANVLTKPEDRLGDKCSLTAFNADALDTLATEILFWLQNQKELFAIFKDKTEYSKEEIVAALKNRLSRMPDDQKDARAMLSKATLSELYRVVSASGTMNLNDKNYLRILTPENGRYRIKDLTASNLAKTGARVLSRAFTNDLSTISNFSGITLPEAQYGYNQFKNLVWDLEILEKGDEGFISSRFLEANLFLAVSDGNDYASFEELHHLVIHIFSGVTRAGVLEEKLLKACVVEQAPILKKSLLSEECAADLYYREEAGFFDLPKFLELKTLPRPKKTKEGEPDLTQPPTPAEEANKAYYSSLLKAAGHVPNDKKTLKTADAALFPHVTQYLEMLFSRHDLNGNNILEKDEAKAAFPVFKNLLTLVVQQYPQVKPEDLEGVFVYLIKFRKPPTTIGEKLNFIAFIKDPEQKAWNTQATRYDLGEIFNFIAETTKPKAGETPVAKIAAVPPLCTKKN